MRIHSIKSMAALILLICLMGANAMAQVVSPVKWSFEQKKISDKEIEVRFNAKIEPGWHLYGTDLPDGGPVSTSVKFTADSLHYRFAGALTPVTQPIRKFDKIFNLELTYFALEAHFTRRITLLANTPFTIKGSIEYQSCNDETCTMDEVDFSFAENESAVVAAKTEAVVPVSPDKEHHSLIWFLFFSFVAGLAAILTPCVFPMIPMTVSFFMNSNKTKWEAKIQAMIYGLSIILIYTLIGTVVAITLGADFANWLSTHWLPNVLFFIVFVVFAFSFFGAFEIILPSSWVNKSDDKVSKGGGRWCVFHGADPGIGLL